LFEPAETLTATRTAPASDLIERALAARADHRAARMRVESAELAISAAGRAWIPSLVLSGGIKTAEDGGETKLGYVAGLGFSLPFFDRGQADRERARAELLEARAELSRLELETRAAVSGGIEALSIHVDRVERFERAMLPHLDALLRRAETTFREGERPVFELLDAYRTARDMRLRHVDLLLEAKRAELELRRVLGER
jgi:cobalt-zinc-cadmium efflux system outer membrane protein